MLEVRRHLEGKRVEPEAIEQAIAALHAQGYLDDERYAQRFAEDRRTLDDWGADRSERRLLAAGIAADVAAGALATREGADELAAAVELLRRRFPAELDTDRDRNRALGVLLRKGYDLELAHDAIRAHARAGA